MEFFDDVVVAGTQNLDLSSSDSEDNGDGDVRRRKNPENPEKKDKPEEEKKPSGLKKREKPSSKSPVLGSASGVIGYIIIVADFVRYIFGKATISSPLSKLHYKTTAGFLFACCIIVSSEDFIGNNISCFRMGGSGTHTVLTPDKVVPLNNYCWVTATYSNPQEGTKNVKGKHNAYQGAGTDRDNKVHHAYYQWVALFLFMQGIMFNVPHFLWTVWENEKMDRLTVTLRGRTLSVDEKKEQLGFLVEYVSETFHLHNLYALKYFFCELLNIVNVVGQIYLTDRFLGGSFIQYGFDVFRWIGNDHEIRNDPLLEVFPRITICDFHQYGPSGTIEKQNAMCLLPQNNFNEKVFIALWVWFIALAILSTLYLIYAVAAVSLTPLRKSMIERNTKHKYLGNKLDVLIQKGQIGDWFLLYLLSLNLDSVLFKAFISELTKKLKSVK